MSRDNWIFVGIRFRETFKNKIYVLLRRKNEEISFRCWIGNANYGAYGCPF